MLDKRLELGSGVRANTAHANDETTDPAPRTRIVSLRVILVIGAISLPLLASATSAVAATPRTTPPIGRQLAELKGSDTVAGDEFGVSVSISGTTAVVGAWQHAKSAGRAYVFTKTAAGWKRTAELKGSDTVADDGFGFAVAISGTTLVVGAPHGNDAGRAYVFTKTATGWKQTAELKGSDAFAGNFGWSVALSGSTAVVGAPDAKSAGRAYVFTKTAAGWKQVAELKGSDPLAGDQFGESVTVSGTTAVVGAPDRAKYAGRAYVFTKAASGWKRAAELKGSDTVANDDFGESVSISGTTAIVGAFGHPRAGRAYVFTKTASGWKRAAELKGSDTVAHDQFGESVAVSGITVVVGAPYRVDHAGRAYVFEA